MELSKQVCSLESANRLKELGVKQESLYLWETGAIKPRIILTFETKEALRVMNIYNYDTSDFREYSSAFTVAELGELLPGRVERNAKDYMLQCLKHGNWEVKYVAYENGIGHVLDSHEVIQWGEEAEARAKMLIYLLENKLI